MKHIWTLDLEANGLDPTKIWCICVKEFGVNNGVCFIPRVYRGSGYSLPDFYKEKNLEEFPQWAKDNASTGRIVYHNGIDYDSYVIQKLLGIDLIQLGFEERDTLVLSRITDVTREGGHSVEAWALRLGMEPKTEVEKWDTFDPIMISRCANDVEIQEKIYGYLRKVELAGFPLSSILLEQEVQRLISKQRRDGVFIDLEQAHRLFTTTKRLADDIQSRVREVFPPRATLVREYTPKVLNSGLLSNRVLGGISDISGPFSRISFEPFNLDSPTQRVLRLLEVGWVPTKYTKPSKTHPKGQPQFTEEDLEHLPENAPKEAKLLGTYLMLRSKQRVANQWLDMVDDKGYLHGTVNPLGARTHRMAHIAPNLGNIARTEVEKATGSPIKGIPGRFGWESRNTFAVETPQSTCYVGVDASGIQLRALAHYANNKEYISRVIAEGYDPHADHATALGCTRAIAKTFLYAFFFGAGVGKIASILGCSMKEAKERLKAFYDKFPFIKQVIDLAGHSADNGYMIALDGRPIKVFDSHSALSVYLQSFEAIVMKRAMVDYQAELKAKGVWFKQRLIVHDEFVTETKKNDVDIVGQTMIQSIVDAGLKLGSNCPLDGDMKQGNTWAECH